jgi:hypothetical protein
MFNVGFDPSDVMFTLPVAFPPVVGANFTLKVTLCPAFNVTGNARPLMLNPAPEVLAALIFKFDPPEFVSVSVLLRLVPTSTLPKFTLEGLAVNAPSATPLPLSGIVSVGFEPSEVIVMSPVALPVAPAANFTLKLTLCPAFSVTGSASPLRLKPAPDAAAAVIFKFDPPEFVSVSVTVWLPPTTTVPKLMVEGVADNAPSATPDPTRAIARFGFDPSDATAMLPDALPVAVGLNFTVKLALCPAFRVTGSVSPLMENCAPVTFAAEMVRLLPPEFVSVSVTLWVTPTCTLPKLTLAGLAASPPSLTPLPVAEIVSGELDASDVILNEPV